MRPLHGYHVAASEASSVWDTTLNSFPGLKKNNTNISNTHNFYNKFHIMQNLSQILNMITINIYSIYRYIIGRFKILCKQKCITQTIGCMPCASLRFYAAALSKLILSIAGVATVLLGFPWSVKEIELLSAPVVVIVVLPIPC